MTTLAEPRSKKVPTRSSARNRPVGPIKKVPTTSTRSRPVGPIDANATTEQLLAQRDALPAGHPGWIRLRAMAIEKSLPMAYRLARRYAGRGEPLEDLAQVAALALMKAVDGYEHSKGVPFHGYAHPTILGALKKHFRDTTWVMRIPRATKDLVLQVTAVSGQLTQNTNRTPTDAELAAHLHVKADDIRAAILARRAYQLASLNMSPVGASDALDLIDLIGGIDPHYAAIDDHVSLSPLLATLPPRERHILYLRFYRAMSQSEIAAQVGVSQMQVCRLLRQSLTRLREAALDSHVS